MKNKIQITSVNGRYVGTALNDGKVVGSIGHKECLAVWSAAQGEGETRTLVAPAGCGRPSITVTFMPTAAKRAVAQYRSGYYPVEDF